MGWSHQRNDKFVINRSLCCRAQKVRLQSQTTQMTLVPKAPRARSATLENLMKPDSIQSLGLGLLTALALSSGALASGTHAGGHDAGDGETAIGKPGVAAKVSRTVSVEMSDNMRFTPSEIKVKKGETIRFAVKNAGQVKHEFSLGTKKELAEHYELMKKFPDMEHDEPNKVSLAPGKQGEVVWQFTKSGNVDFACLHPGHYEAGMKGLVKVSK